MDMKYILFGVVAIAATALTTLVMYLIYGRGIAVRLILVLQICIAITAVVTLMLGMEGVTLTRGIISALIQTPVYITVFVAVARQIVIPARQMVAVSAAIAIGDVDQQVTFVRQDE